VKLAGKPFVVHALERLAASQRIARAVIAITAGDEAGFEEALRGVSLPYELVAGGVTRRDSVAAAFAAADLADDDLACIHDAARPLVDPAEVAAVVDTAAETGAAVAGFSAIETIKRVLHGKIVGTVPRNDLVAATTPQVFRAALLRVALDRDAAREVTDESELVERSGVAVSVVLTSRWNLKITYPEDLVWAEAFLRKPQA